MPEYRRFRVEGGIYFFTVVTYQRRPILIEPIARKLLHNAWDDTNRRFPCYMKKGMCDANWVGGDEGRLKGFEFD